MTALALIYGRLVGWGVQSYDPTMKIILYIAAFIAFIGPILGWAYIASLASAYNLNSPNRGLSLSDYWDLEFLILAIVPWLICVTCLFFASRLS